MMSPSEADYAKEIASELLSRTNYKIMSTRLCKESNPYALGSMEAKRATLLSLSPMLTEAEEERKKEVGACEAFTRCKANKTRTKSSSYEYIDIDTGMKIDYAEYERRYMMFIMRNKPQPQEQAPTPEVVAVAATLTVLQEIRVNDNFSFAPLPADLKVNMLSPKLKKDRKRKAESNTSSGVSDRRGTLSPGSMKAILLAGLKEPGQQQGEEGEEVDRMQALVRHAEAEAFGYFAGSTANTASEEVQVLDDSSFMDCEMNVSMSKSKGKAGKSKGSRRRNTLSPSGLSQLARRPSLLLSALDDGLSPFKCDISVQMEVAAPELDLLAHLSSTASPLPSPVSMTVASVHDTVEIVEEVLICSPSGCKRSPTHAAALSSCELMPPCPTDGHCLIHSIAVDGSISTESTGREDICLVKQLDILLDQEQEQEDMEVMVGDEMELQVIEMEVIEPMPMPMPSALTEAVLAEDEMQEIFLSPIKAAAPETESTCPAPAPTPVTPASSSSSSVVPPSPFTSYFGQRSSLQALLQDALQILLPYQQQPESSATDDLRAFQMIEQLIWQHAAPEGVQASQPQAAVRTVSVESAEDDKQAGQMIYDPSTIPEAVDEAKAEQAAHRRMRERMAEVRCRYLWEVVSAQAANAAISRMQKMATEVQ